MSRRGNCHDNAVVGGFFANLKKEKIKRKKHRAREDARQAHNNRVAPAVYEQDIRCYNKCWVNSGRIIFSPRRTLQTFEDIGVLRPNKTIILLVVTLFSALLATNIYAENGLPPLVTKYTLHGLKVTNILILAVILFRKSIGHQSRMNWFFGAVATVTISTQTLIFERYFGTPGSLLNDSFTTLVLAGFFIFYLFGTWRPKRIE